MVRKSTPRLTKSPSLVLIGLVLTEIQAFKNVKNFDLGLIHMFLINLNAEIVACILSLRKLRHKPNLENTYGLLAKCEVKMAGYWPSSFFACLWTETKKKLHKLHKLAKKRTRPISSHLERTNLVNKGFIIWLLVKFSLRDTAGSPERARWLHLARSGSQSQRAIWFILPARGTSHIINTSY